MYLKNTRKQENYNQSYISNLKILHIYDRTKLIVNFYMTIQTNTLVIVRIFYSKMVTPGIEKEEMENN